MHRRLPILASSAALVPSLLGAAREEEPPVALSSLIEEALAKNPEIQAASREVGKRKARVPQRGALPDPMLSYGVMNEGRPVPFETLGEAGFSEVYVGIAQDLPYPGKRGLREEVAREEARAAEWAVESARRRVVSQVKQAYYDLYAVDAALEIVERNRELLENLERVASTLYTVGQTVQQHVLDAQVEISRLEERWSVLRQKRSTVEALLDSLLYRESANPYGRAEPLRPAPLVQDMEELWRMAEEASPALLEQTQRVAASERGLALAQKELLPDLGVNFVYHNRGGLDPYYTFGGTLSLPLYAGGKQRKAIEEASEGLVESRHTFDAARARVRYEVTDAYLRAKTAERLLSLYEEGILRQARLSLDSATAQYQVGRVDFLTLLNAWMRLLDHDLTYHEQIAEHEKALARLESHVGVQLTSLP
jgi:outer membrane protein TolC